MIRKQIKANLAGFTLTELLISIAVVSILAGLTAQVFSVVLDSRNKALDRLEINETGRTAITFMANELRTAYITPDSVKPFDPNQTTSNPAPRFRFAGISNLDEVDATILPGGGVDDDGDGDTDEEILNGFDDDGDGLVDEDIGVIPRDVIHFVSAVEGSSGIQLQEISYGLDPSGTRLVRRAQLLNPDSNSTQSILDFGQFIDNASGRALVPPALPLFSSPNSGAVNTVLANWDAGAQFGQIQNSGSTLTNNNPAKIFQVLSYDIRGLSFRYWYYDYNRGGWRWVPEWDSSQETALLNPNARIFNEPAANNSLEGSDRRSFANIIVNEPDDLYPRGNAPGTFLVSNTNQLRAPEFQASLQRIAERTDGLPNMVEITIWVQDEDRERTPNAYTMRVFIPNNYRSIGF